MVGERLSIRQQTVKELLPGSRVHQPARGVFSD